jgi:lipopolysaccharide/colanic/teichoic acid biosynthesis glycosyltransferase
MGTNTIETSSTHSPAARLGRGEDANRKTLHRSLKRLIDLGVGSIAALLSLPACAVIALLIKIDSSGPIIFPADRIGEGGKRFTLYKFRSMVADAHQKLDDLAHLNEGGKFMIKIPNDPRVTRVGRVLRKYSLDEIPQLWNVIRGDMSLVGPRPQAPDEVAHYDEKHCRRLSVPAGITGLWQVTARNDVRFEVWIAKDLEYIANWSVWLDLKIMLRTILVVLAGKGAAPSA